MKTSHTLVVSLLLLFLLYIWIKTPPLIIFVPSVRKSMMASNNIKCCPSWSTLENKLLAIALAITDVLYPSAYSTSYILVSSIEFSAASPIGLPSFSFNILLTLANSGPLSCLSSASYMLT